MTRSSPPPARSTCPTRNRRPAAGRLSAALLVLVALLVVVAHGGLERVVADEPAPAVPATVAPAALALREQDLLKQFRELERTFLRLADLLAPSDPRRAALLRNVFEQARSQEVGSRLDTIVQLLEQGQLLKAGTTQASTLDRLRELLQLLESGDTDRRLTNTKEEVRQFLSRLSKIMARQRDIEGSTESGAQEAGLAQRQDALAEETSGLSRDIGSFSKRMEATDAPQADAAGGQPADSQPQGEKNPAEQPAPTPQNADDNAKAPDSSAPAAGDSKPQEPGADGGKAPEGEGGKTPPGDAPAGQPGKSGGAGEGSEGEAAPQQPAEEMPEPSAAEAAGEPEGDDESSRAKRSKSRLEAAEKRMREAEQKIEKSQRRDARKEQEKAIEELETARAELEEILRQMREQEVERLLVQLEARLRGMLRVEKGVLAGVEKLAAEPPAAEDRQRQLEAARLGREQAAVGLDATKALTLVRDDGSAVAIPEALEQVRDDAAAAAGRLGRGDAGATTRGIVQDIVANLEEMLAALEKAQAQQQARQKGAAGGRPAEPGEQPLVDKLSELKMIRSLQMRVNTRTKRFSQLLTEGAEQADEPELLDAVRRLSDRQRKIERAAHGIVSGLTE